MKTTILLAAFCAASLANAGQTGLNVEFKAAAQYNTPMPPADVLTTSNTKYLQASNTSAATGTYFTTGFDFKVIGATAATTMRLTSLTFSVQYDADFDGAASVTIVDIDNVPLNDKPFGAYGPPGGAFPDLGGYVNDTLTTGSSSRTSTVTANHINLSNDRYPMNGGTAGSPNGWPRLRNRGESYTVTYKLGVVVTESGSASVTFPNLVATARVIVLSSPDLDNFSVVPGEGNWNITLPGILPGEAPYWRLEQSTDLVVWQPGDPGDTVSVNAGVLSWTPNYEPSKPRNYWRARWND